MHGGMVMMNGRRVVPLTLFGFGRIPHRSRWWWITQNESVPRCRMRMDVNEEIHTSIRPESRNQFFDGNETWLHRVRRLRPPPIVVNSERTGAIIPDECAVRVKHRHDDEGHLATESLCIPVRRTCYEIQEALHDE